MGFVAMLQSIMREAAEKRRKEQRKSPPGLGGYRIVKTKDIHVVDKKRMLGVPLFRAELIERNKYAPGWETRGKHLGPFNVLKREPLA